jgi:hypothetical protein
VRLSLKAKVKKDSSRASSATKNKTQSKFPSIRFLTIGLWPGFGSKKSCIRLQGNWLREAGFIPRWQVKVAVTKGKLVLEAIEPTEPYLG